MARGWHYTKLSLSSVLLLSFSGICFVFKEKSELLFVLFLSSVFVLFCFHALVGAL